ncbi:MAG: hypothetical protein DRO40_08255 [Thermoprotei archaeon]|nr:MAG: hypothetical protein DRO40_08255 [Thermoprotei archaeon]
MKRYLKYLLPILEGSSIPLLFIITILILSGYGILYPARIKILTGGLMTEGLAYKIHTDKIIRLSTLVLLFIHGYAGVLILIEKYVRTELLKNVLILICTIILVYLYSLMILLDILR